MSKCAFFAFVASALLLPAVSQAVTVVGDLSGSEVNTYGLHSIVDIPTGAGGDGSLAHLSASTIFTWTNGVGWQGDVAIPYANLKSDYFILGEGETTLTFQAKALSGGSGIRSAYVEFMSDLNASGAFGYGYVDITSTNWNSYTFDLYDYSGNFTYLPAGSKIWVFATVQQQFDAPSYNGTQDGQTVTMQSDLFVDNFTTAVVPEPTTLLSLFIALAGNGLYLRRRLAA